jgi:hypothetical protein
LQAFAYNAPPGLRLIVLTDVAHRSGSDRGVRVRRFQILAQHLLRKRTHKTGAAVRS